PSVRGDVLQKLGEIAFVRANGMARHTAIEREVLAKGLHVIRHAAACRIHTARSSSARLAIASFLSSLLIGRGFFPCTDGVCAAPLSIGSMMPNVMFEGS